MRIRLSFVTAATLFLTVLSCAWAIGGAAAAAGTLEEETARILRAVPQGSGESEAAWIYGQARTVVDARLALRLMDEISPGDGESAARARLWKVRFWMAAGEKTRAGRELDALEEPRPSAPWRAEASFWRALVSGNGDWEEGLQERASVPPWAFMAAIARVHEQVESDEEVRGALALEGRARRLGLLGPWLWRLLRARDARLHRAGLVILENVAATIVAAPEAADLLARTREAEELAAAGKREAPVGSSAEPRGRFAVQIGSYHEKGVAAGLLDELGTHDFEAHLTVSFPKDKAPVYRVRLGPCETLSEAESIGVALSRELMIPYQIVEVP